MKILKFFATLGLVSIPTAVLIKMALKNGREHTDIKLTIEENNYDTIGVYENLRTLLEGTSRELDNRLGEVEKKIAELEKQVNKPKATRAKKATVEQ